MPLKITVPPVEVGYNPHTREFLYSHDKEVTLTLEHSLVSLSKWEAKWKKPFLIQKELTHEQTIDYIRCMTITQNVDPRVYAGITDEIIDEINAYIKDPMTATWFAKDNKKNQESVIITSERIYYWMSCCQLPSSCEKWHLNRLFTLLKICELESRPKKKIPQKDTAAQYRALNAKRRKALRSKG